MATVNLNSVKVNIKGGILYPNAPQDNGLVVEQVLHSQNIPGATSVPGEVNGYSDFLNVSKVWIGTSNSIDSGNIALTIPVNKGGNYSVEFAAGYTGLLKINGITVIEIQQKSALQVYKRVQRLDPGTHYVRITANREPNEDKYGVAFSIKYKESLNVARGPVTFIELGDVTSDFYKRKDAFNYVYNITGLTKGAYKLRVRRVTPERTQEMEEEAKTNTFDSAVLASAACFDETQPPTRPLPRVNLARTAVRVQSTSKANGQLEGINAIVQTKFYDWDRDTNRWVFRVTQNPASLFLYVLTHPANAYRLADASANNFLTTVASKVDLAKLIDWHNFCNPVTPTRNNPKLTFNAVLTNTSSIMDTLRDICAAGKASPVFIDGKWGVVIDRLRPYAVQHFTPHNSWGFEARKILPRIPHAFRVTFQDEQYNYETKEMIYYNYGYGTEPGKLVAEIFEELQLPGVTNEPQARHLAYWHFAQLKLRPESYTLNTDFEYLVCNRGDLVKVTHDVPLWGTASGRLRQINYATKTIVLSEEVQLESSKTYKILIRGNTLNTVGSGSGAYKTLTQTHLTIAQVPTNTYTDTITVIEPITETQIQVDNLFMIGESTKETQELIVLSVEPQSNLSAKITLTDYSPQIYTADLESELEYDANITIPGTGIFETSINGYPIIHRATSVRGTSEAISVGTYQTVTMINFSNTMGNNRTAQLVQFELGSVSEELTGRNTSNLYPVEKGAGSIVFRGLETDKAYRVRARYMNREGTVFGPWSPLFTFVVGPAGLEPTVPQLSMDLENTYIVAKVPQTVARNPDFRSFEYRLYKDTGVEDFWELVPDATNNIKVIESMDEARFNLLDLPLPRISEAGITYRVACRSVSRTGEYSSQSALGTIVVKTIT